MSKVKVLSETTAKRDTSWNEVTGKPQEFTPKPHTHEISDIADLDSNLQGLNQEIQINKKELEQYIRKLEAKVDKEEGKGLSEVNFTLQRDQQILDLLQRVKELERINKPNGNSENGGLPDKYVISVNGNSGEVTINKTTLGLDKVLNKEQATKEDLEQVIQATLSNQSEVVKLEKDLKIHAEDTGLHLSKEDRDMLSTLGDIPRYKKGTNELEAITLANQKTPLEIAALRNIAIVDNISEAEQFPNGTIIFVKGE